MDLSKLNVNRLRTELWTCHILAEQRCLRRACEWAEDMLYALKEKKEEEEKLLVKLEKDHNDLGALVNPKYEHAKACFELNEYDRAAHIVRDQMMDDKCRFLHYFCLYKAAEKKRIDLMNEVNIGIPAKAQLKFEALRDSLERSMDKRKPDGWLLYVYGLVLQKFRLTKQAIEILKCAICEDPINWSAWYMLASIIDSEEQLEELQNGLPYHLFRVFFYYIVRLSLDLPTTTPWTFVGYKDTKNFIDKHFKDSHFIKTLEAKSLSYQSNRYKDAMDIFRDIRFKDPYRIDSMEVYSNLMYVRKLRKDLAKLAYEIERVDPFTSEANSCIANSFSARDQHTKAIVYFTRALKLNPDHLNPWTLIGHEYLEMRRTDQATQAYRFAISINKRDCRAWLGLGNSYETKMSTETADKRNFEGCLYYYSQVGKYRPKDHIMFMAMGSIYEKIGNIKEAIYCVKQAGTEGLFKLAKLYESNNMRQEANETYKKWLAHLDEVKRTRGGEQYSDMVLNSTIVLMDHSINNSGSIQQSMMTNLSDLDAGVQHARRYISAADRDESF